MEKLIFTTSEPQSFGMSGEPLIGEQKTINISDPLILDSAYIHGKAEELAGFDIPIFLAGDLSNLDLPIEEQQIYMLLPSGEYKCKSMVNPGVIKSHYLLTLYEE
jgi:hypothetical protein